MKKKILIISNKQDSSTIDVTDWIEQFNFEFLILTFEEMIEQYTLSRSLTNRKDVFCLVSNFNQPLQFNSAWFRRNTPYSKIPLIEENIVTTTKEQIYNHLVNEIECIKKSFFRQSDNLIWLSEYHSKSMDKFDVLMKAKDIGLDIPNTLITNSKKALEEFIQQNKIVICKSLYEENLSIFIQEKVLAQYVTELRSNDLINISNRFLPSFFQEKIDKEFEVRTFFLNNECYSMAVFDSSQNVDMKKEYSAHRNLPFKLPKKLERKVCILMEELGLKTGSIDFLKDKYSDTFYFLEINPVGQFGNVSSYCNYNLEKKIAQFLCYGH